MDKKAEQKSVLAERISEQMSRTGLRVSELGREVGLPQTTLSRLLTGETDNPTASTLEALSDYFEVSIDWLLGREQEGVDIEKIIEKEEEYESMPRKKAPIPAGISKRVPIIDWAKIKRWVYQPEGYSSSEIEEWVAAADQIEEGAYALRVGSRPMGTHFESGSLIIVERWNQYQDGDYVVASVDRRKPVLYEVIDEAGKLYLNSLLLREASVLIGENVVLYGKVVEVRRRFI